MIKVVLFDLDDTLFATREAKWEQHKYVAKKFYNKDLADEEILVHWGKPFPQLVCLLYGTEKVEEALVNNASCYEDFPKIIYEETLSTLENLKLEGKLVGIVTAASKDHLERDLASYNISKDFFDYTQTAEDTKFHKPDPQVFEPVHEWLSGKEIRLPEVLYVGDALHDMKAAIGAGFNFLGVETGLVTATQFKENEAFSVPGIADLIKFLNK